MVLFFRQVKMKHSEKLQGLLVWTCFQRIDKCDQRVSNGNWFVSRCHKPKGWVSLKQSRDHKCDTFSVVELLLAAWPFSGQLIWWMWLFSVLSFEAVLNFIQSNTISSLFQSCPATHVALPASFQTESFMARGTTWGTRSDTAVSPVLCWKDTASSRVLYRLAAEHSGTSHHHFAEVKMYFLSFFINSRNAWCQLQHNKC